MFYQINEFWQALYKKMSISPNPESFAHAKILADRLGLIQSKLEGFWLTQDSEIYGDLSWQILMHIDEWNLFHGFDPSQIASTAYASFNEVDALIDSHLGNLSFLQSSVLTDDRPREVFDFIDSFLSDRELKPSTLELFQFETDFILNDPPVIIRRSAQLADSANGPMGVAWMPMVEIECSQLDQNQSYCHPAQKGWICAILFEGMAIRQLKLSANELGAVHDFLLLARQETHERRPAFDMLKAA